MDKNIAALLREDTKTVLVHFHVSTWEKKLAYEHNRNVNNKACTYVDNRAYTYVTHLNLAIGDQVIVHASDVLTIATVDQVDEGVDIQPNSDIQYKWVLAKVDLTEATANAQRNAEIETVVNDAYKVKLRRSFAQQILSGVEPAQQLRLEGLLK